MVERASVRSAAGIVRNGATGQIAKARATSIEPPQVSPLEDIRDHQAIVQGRVVRTAANPRRGIVRNNAMVCDAARHTAATASSFVEQRREISADDAIIQSTLVR